MAPASPLVTPLGMAFMNVKSNSFLQVIFRATYWIRQWSLLHTEEERVSLKGWLWTFRDCNHGGVCQVWMEV